MQEAEVMEVYYHQAMQVSTECHKHVAAQSLTANGIREDSCPTHQLNRQNNIVSCHLCIICCCCRRQGIQRIAAKAAMHGKRIWLVHKIPHWQDSTSDLITHDRHTLQEVQICNREGSGRTRSMASAGRRLLNTLLQAWALIWGNLNSV